MNTNTTNTMNTNTTNTIEETTMSLNNVIAQSIINEKLPDVRSRSDKIGDSLAQFILSSGSSNWH